MSPLILVGLLVFATLNPSLADVKHVLEGSAHPPNCKCAEGGHHHYQNTDSHYSGGFSASGNYNGGFPGVPSPAGAANNAVPGSVAFWWMDSNSPFKHAYDHFKKCSLKGNCFPPVAPGFEAGNNLPQGGCGPSGCTVSGSIDLKGKGGGAEFGPVDIKKNPFLNGQIQGVAGAGATASVGSGRIDISGNPFLNQGGQAAYSGNGQAVVTGSDGFLGVQPSVPFGKGGSKVQPFPTTYPASANINVQGSQPFPTAHPSQPGAQPFPSNYPGGDGKFQNCQQPGHVCVAQDLCINGLVKTHGQGLFQQKNSVDYCEIGKEVCCRLPEGAGSSYQPGGSRSSFSSYTSSGSSLATSNSGSAAGAFGSGSTPGAFGSGSTSGAFGSGSSSGAFGSGSTPGAFGSRSTSGAFGSGSSSGGFGSGSTPGAFGPGSSSGVFSSGSTHGAFDSGSTSGAFGSGSSSAGFGSGFANLSDITVGKSSVPGSTIKFSGGAGLSGGVIQVLSPNEDVPNPFVSTAGESGAAVIHSGSSVTNKVVRDTTPNPNSVFSSTIDYSNDKLDQLSFVSTTRGPQYLPPVSTPIPSVHTPDLEVPISTYQPSVPTTSRPFVTKPIIPGSSVVSVYTPKPFVPSSPKPFDIISPQPQQPVPSYTKPNQYLPPLQPSSPKPFVHQPSQPPTSYTPFPTRPSVTFTQPPFTRAPTFPTSYIPPRTSSVYIPPRVTPSPPTFKPYNPPTYQPSPQPSSQVTGGYSYPTPTPAFEYPKPTPKQPLIPSQSVTVNNQYIPPKQPSPSPTTTSNQYIPPSVPQPTPGYRYPTPSPPFEISRQPSPTTLIGVNNQYVPPKQPSHPTPGYSYPTPTPPFIYSKPTPKPYNPQPQPSDGYTYNTPTPAFNYPTPSPTSPPRITVPPYKPTNNGYLPPRIPDGSNFNNNYIRPTQGPAYIPPIEGQPANPGPAIVPFPTPAPVPHAGCAAALRCVQEIYCTADGFISQTPVTLSRDQEYLRVPTTDCSDEESGIVGKCCRDPNYVDPWPSANLINGFDNGQYREDPQLGQYFPQKQRAVRSETSGNSQNALGDNSRKAPIPQQINAQTSPAISQQFNVQAVAESRNDNTCGIRNPNAEPRGPGAIDVAFGEIPWQAMVLRDGNRSLLCGGVIVKPNAVLTAAHCVDGLSTSDVLIKGGEWKLGIDEEPLPFQIVKVAAIIRHPGYQAGSLVNDLALLMLHEKLRVANNVAPICLPPPNQPPSGQCIATGWGKQILQVHLKGAIMKSVDVNILDSNQCRETLANRYQNVLQNYAPNTICGYSQNDQCDVDYGSALACTNGNGQYTLAGIYSFDTGCKDESQIGGYIAPDIEWIESTCSKPLTHLKALDRQYRRNQ